MALKNKLKICFYVSIVTLVINSIYCVMDIVDKISWGWLLLDVFYILCNITCMVGFVIFLNKPIKYIITKKVFFVIVICLACLSSLLLAIVALFLVSEYNRTRFIMKIKEQQAQDGQNDKNEAGVPVEINMNVDKTKIELELLELKTQLTAGEINEEEYEKLKQEILNKHFKL